MSYNRFNFYCSSKGIGDNIVAFKALLHLEDYLTEHQRDEQIDFYANENIAAWLLPFFEIKPTGCKINIKTEQTPFNACDLYADYELEFQNLYEYRINRYFENIRLNTGARLFPTKYPILGRAPQYQQEPVNGRCVLVAPFSTRPIRSYSPMFTRELVLKLAKAGYEVEILLSLNDADQVHKHFQGLPAIAHIGLSPSAVIDKIKTSGRLYTVDNGIGHVASLYSINRIDLLTSQFHAEYLYYPYRGKVADFALQLDIHSGGLPLQVAKYQDTVCRMSQEKCKNCNKGCLSTLWPGDKYIHPYKKMK